MYQLNITKLPYSIAAAHATAQPSKVLERNKTTFLSFALSPDPHKLIWKPQSSSGDQSDESRVAFYNSGFAACVKCGERNVWRFEEKAGIRQNGETYGTEIFRCQTKGCKWKTSFKYDDKGRGMNLASRLLFTAQ